MDFDRGEIAVRRSWSKGNLGVPKSGKGRVVSIPAGVGSVVFDHLVARRRECLERGWSDVPPWVFCSESGGLLDERDVRLSRARCCQEKKRNRAQSVAHREASMPRADAASPALGT